jgi:hypothetical protein
MTKYAYEYGKRWDARVPRVDLCWLMGRVHVGTPDETVAEDIRQRTKGFPPTVVRQSIAYALECHRRNQCLYTHVMRGR